MDLGVHPCIRHHPCYMPAMRSFPVTVLCDNLLCIWTSASFPASGIRSGSRQPLLHTDFEVIPCYLPSFEVWPLASALDSLCCILASTVFPCNILIFRTSRRSRLFRRSFQPERIRTIPYPYPGFQHRFIGLYFMNSDQSCPRSTCRSVQAVCSFCS